MKAAEWMVASPWTLEKVHADVGRHPVRWTRGELQIENGGHLSAGSGRDGQQKGEEGKEKEELLSFPREAWEGRRWKWAGEEAQQTGAGGDCTGQELTDRTQSPGVYVCMCVCVCVRVCMHACEREGGGERERGGQIQVHTQQAYISSSFQRLSYTGYTISQKDSPSVDKTFTDKCICCLYNLQVPVIDIIID